MWTKSLLLIALQLGSAGADAYYTNRHMQMPIHYEANPIARPFVGSTHGVVLYFSATAGLHIVGAHLLRRHGHNRLADAVMLEGIADNAVGAVGSRPR